jgi:putative phage-type endonuclease
LNKKVLSLFNLPQPPQRSEEWFIQRNKQITASEVASCLFFKKEVIQAYNEVFPKAIIKENPKKGENHYENLDEYIKKKCKIFYSNNYEPFKDTIYTLHGKLYEPVATRFYCINKRCNINDFGLITHDKLKWLAASPDGITDDGVMLEIKCPLSRKIDTESIPFGYWLQTQIQMEVCDLDQCDFLECEIAQITEQEFFELDEEVLAQGLAGAILEKDYDNKIYEYADKNILNKDSYRKFIDNEYKKIYYRINNWNIINLKRNKSWFKDIKKDLFEVYKRIQKYQTNKDFYHKYLESFGGPLYKKSLISLDKKETEFTDDLMSVDIEEITDSDEEQIENYIEIDVDESEKSSSVSCNISFDIDL